MTHPASKFATPPPPPSFVARPRLEARLDAASTARLTVVSGRAGAGKTALLAQWITTIDAGDRAWITLDAGDNTPATFWGDVDATLQQLSRDARAGFNTRREWRDAFLVLDDAHVLTTAEARHNLAALVGLIPPWMHLVVAGRGQVPISLWRLRTAGALVEIDDADLRLDRDEAAGIIAADGAPASAALDELHRLTDGWVTGLKLLTSARHSSVDAQDALREFFLDEVFTPQSPELQRFLMETAPLERLTPGLCERVTGRADAADVLHELERANLFVNRLPGRYGTYEVHPQFRAVLRDELGARRPARVGRIHDAAARWYEDHGNADAAVEHWLAAGNVTDAVRLLPSVRTTDLDADRDAVIRALLVRIHPSMGTANVWRLLDYATALATMEQDAPLTEVLDQIDAILINTPDDAASFRTAFLRGLLHVRTGDVEAMVGALEHAQDILDMEPELERDARLDAGPRVPELSVWLGHGYRWQERPRDANRALARTTAASPDRRNIHFRDSARAAVAFASGRLAEAAHVATRALERAHQLGMKGDATTRSARHVLAGLLAEWDDLAGAQGTLEKLTEPPHGSPTDVFAVTARIQLAEVLRAERDVSTALEMLFAIREQRTYPRGSAIDTMLRRATVLSLLAIGRIDAARVTLGPPPYPGGLAIAAALVEITDGEPEIASDYLDAFCVDTPRRLLGASLLRARVVVARAGDDREVERHLRRALRIARREGFVRSVVHLAPDLIDRFPALCTSPAESEYVATLRRARGRTLGIVDEQRSVESQLSGRELEVLSYMPTQLSAREIAETLHVSLNTVKSHMQSVYRKLGCESREAAVARARRLQLLR